jgi:hypothetical protein
MRARISRANSLVLIRKRQPRNVQIAPPRPMMSKAQKKSTNVCPGKDVLKSVAKMVRAADSKHKPIVSKSETGAPCSSFSNSCSEMV